MSGDGQDGAPQAAAADDQRPLHELIDAWRDGTIDPAGALALVAVIEGDAAAASDLRAAIAFEGQLAQAIDAHGADDVVRGVLERIRAEESSQSFASAFRNGPLAQHCSRRRRAVVAARRPWAVLVTAAALVTLAVGIAWWQQGRSVADPASRTLGVVLAVAAGQVVLVDGALAGPAERTLVVGASLTTGTDARAALTWPDGTRLDLEPGTRLRLVDDGLGGIGPALDGGAVVAAVAKRSAAARFGIDTPQARIEVLGTQFRVTVASSATDVMVSEGAVRFANRGAEDSGTLVAAGESAAAGGVFHVDGRGVDQPGGGSASAPWRSLDYAVSRVAPGRGHTIRLAAGEHLLARPVQIPPGVNLIGAGRDRCTVGGTGDGFLLICAGATPEDGMQTIAGFTIDGRQGALRGGLRVSRHRVTVRDLAVTATRAVGVQIDDGRQLALSAEAPAAWLRGIRVLDCRFRDCSRAGGNWNSTGALTIGALDGAEIAGLDIDECGSTGRPGRTGFGVMYCNGGWFRGLVLRDGDIRLVHRPNSDMALLLRNCHAGSVIARIRSNTTLRFENSEDGSEAEALTVRDCVLRHPDNRRDDTLLASIWMSLSHGRCHGNYIENPASLGAVVVWSDHDVRDIEVRNNVVSGNRQTAALVTVAPRAGGVRGLRVVNNVVERTAHALALHLEYASQVEGLLFANNLVIGNVGTFLVVSGARSAIGLEIADNVVWNGTLPEWSHQSGNRIVDPQLERAGDQPFPFYRPRAGSPLIDAGRPVGLPFAGRAPDIGAWETGAAP